MRKTITLEASLGQHINDFYAEVVAEVNRTGETLPAKHNDITVIAGPGDTLADLQKRRDAEAKRIHDEAPICWVATYPDQSGAWVFRTEIEALRFAIERSCQVRQVCNGGDVFGVPDA